MVIGFRKEFVSKIKSGSKLHTIRKDELLRWKKGMTMHMATGVRTANYKCFKKTICTSIQSIRIVHFDGQGHCKSWASVWIDGKPMSDNQVRKLAVNDGFESPSEFFKWFNTNFTGRIIHWAKKKY